MKKKRVYASRPAWATQDLISHLQKYGDIDLVWALIGNVSAIDFFKADLGIEIDKESFFFPPNSCV